MDLGLVEEPSREQQAMILRAHKKLGHPQNPEFARQLRIGGVRTGVVNWVRRHFKCPECARNKKAGVRRPAATPRSYAFNRVVGTDVVFLPRLNIEEDHPWLNCVCWGVMYQVVEKLLELNSTQAWQAFVRAWVRYFSFPEIIITDQGSEFKGDFAMGMESNHVFQHMIDSHAPWQNGRTEKLGGVLKAQYRLARDEVEPITEEENDLLI